VDYRLIYFQKLDGNNPILKLDTLLQTASMLIKRYVSQGAYKQALSKTDSLNAPAHVKVPAGSAWKTPTQPDQADGSAENLQP
jgi:hypothetical protein